MKIKLSKIFYLIIIFILLLDFKFFYIIPRSFLDSINNNHQKIVIVLVILISLVLFCKYIMRSQNLIFKNYILIFILFVLSKPDFNRFFFFKKRMDFKSFL